MAGHLQDLRALVVGVADEVGASIADGLAGAGAHLVVADADGSAAERVAAELVAAGAQAHGAAVDLSDPASVEALFAMADSALGGLDVLVNGAGRAGRQDFLEITEDEFIRLHEHNTHGVFACTQQAARRMSTGGRIINVCSLAARQPSPQAAAYATTQAAILSLTQSSAKSFGPQQVTVNAVGTNLDDGLVEGDPRAVPLGAVGTAQDLTSLVLFLASAQAGHITGQFVTADGGMVMT